MPGTTNSAGAVRRTVPRSYRQSLSSLCREHTIDAVNTLVTIMNDDFARPSDRIKAASEILDRGYGRPAQQVNVVNDDKPHVDMTDEQLMALIAEGQAAMEAQGLELDDDEGEYDDTFELGKVH